MLIIYFQAILQIFSSWYFINNTVCANANVLFTVYYLLALKYPLSTIP
jgi:hypothetical protein